MLSKFAAERPVTNFFLYWVLMIRLLTLEEMNTESSPIIYFAILSFSTLYYIWYPLSIYQYLLHRDSRLKYYVEKEYPRIEFGKWLITIVILLSGLSSIIQANDNIEQNKLFGILGSILAVSWWYIYARLCWRTSKLLEKHFDVHMGIRPYDGYHFTSRHELTFFLLLAWPFPGIFHVGDRILPVLRRERNQCQESLP